MSLNLQQTEDHVFLAPTLNISPASSNADSDKSGNVSAPPLGRTPSDKLSALPFSAPDIPLHSRRDRTSNFASNVKRAYRRSFDGTLSLPTLPRADHDHVSSLKHGTKSWVSPRESGMGVGGGSRSSTQDPTTREGHSSGKDTPQRVSFDEDRNSLPAMPSVGQGSMSATANFHYH